MIYQFNIKLLINNAILISGVCFLFVKNAFFFSLLKSNFQDVSLYFIIFRVLYINLLENLHISIVINFVRKIIKCI